MKLNVYFKFIVAAMMLLSVSARAAIIDFTIDVSADIYDPVGMTWDGQYLWVVDDENDFEAHQINPWTGEILTTFAVNPGNLDEPDTEGITWDGSHLWVMESSGILGKYTTTGELVDTLSLGRSESDGITWHEGFFWYTNKTNGKVFQIDEYGEGARGFDTNLTEIDSIDIYNDSIWVGDDGSDKIYQYDIDTFELLDVIDLDPLLEQAGFDITYNDPKGLTWDDSGNLWFSDDGDEVLVRINYNAIAVSEPSTIALFSALFALVMFRRKKS